jgi:hypothetical protein
MSRFLVEIPHSSEYEGCIRSLAAIMNYGSHLVTHADFGCDDGVHVGWLIVEADNHEAALQMVPPPYRSDARAVRLRKWTLDEIEAMLKELEG